MRLPTEYFQVFILERPVQWEQLMTERALIFLFTANRAEEVELWLFENLDSKTEFLKLKLKERERHIWHIYVTDLKPGQLYGYRASGPYDPAEGKRLNPNKLLLDPYARAISGRIDWHDSVFGYKIGDPFEDLSFNGTDSAPYMPRSVVLRDFTKSLTDSRGIEWRCWSSVGTVNVEKFQRVFSSKNSGAWLHHVNLAIVKMELISKVVQWQRQFCQS